jgi:alpha-galactosidase
MFFLTITIQCGICQPTPGSAGNAIMQLDKWRIEYHLADGSADVFYGGELVIPQASAVVHLPEVVSSTDYKIHKLSHRAIHDRFGRGVEYVVESSNGREDTMIQTFWLYENSDYFLADVEIANKSGVTANFMSPITSQTPSHFLPAGDDRALFVPFDNDMWVRYRAEPFGGEVTSYEVSTLYDNASRMGLVLGSIEHDLWKTGVRSVTSSNAVTRLEVFGGITSTNTHDVLPHGDIRGPIIRSPKIFIGCFSDWRAGLETYAKANAIVTPPRPWTGGVPFGWNSWGKLQFNLTYEKAIQVSDFFARDLPQFKNHGVAYIGLDAGWNKLTDTQLKAFVEHCKVNHQEAGIYFTPFTAWTKDGNKPVDGTNFKYKDIFLYANGNIQTIDGGVALDPTHPGTKALIQSNFNRFKRAGFKYVKLDFMTHGALEADSHYDPQVSTGIQAYNQGMDFISQQAGKDVYLNLSISPLFPAQYANSRRIACDTFGAIGQVEYMLNSLTYGWWLDGVYDFNDGDHMVLADYSEGENRARVTSDAITGLMISGDDLSDGGDAPARQRAKQFLTNEAINGMARSKRSFRPVEGNSDDHAASLFMWAGQDGFYLAAFNYSSMKTTTQIDLVRAGLPGNKPVQWQELWSHNHGLATNRLDISIDPADVLLLKFN